LKPKGAVTIGFHLFAFGDEIQERVEILGAGTTSIFKERADVNPNPDNAQ
jgi:hypothetical protein